VAAVGVFDVYSRWNSNMVESAPSPDLLLQRHNFGEHERSKLTSCVRDAFVPVKFETFQKTLSKFSIMFLWFRGLIYDISILRHTKSAINQL
jgi:hypothetical protein